VLGVCRASLHDGSYCRGLAPWVILADGPGGLTVPGLARVGVSGIVRRIALAPRAVSSTTAAVGGSLDRVPRLICGHGSCARRENGAGKRRIAGACPAVRGPPGPAGPAVRLRQPTGCRTVGRGERSWYKIVRSVDRHRAESARRSKQWPPSLRPIAPGHPGLPSGCRARTSASKPTRDPGLPVVVLDDLVSLPSGPPSSAAGSQRPAQAEPSSSWWIRPVRDAAAAVETDSAVISARTSRARNPTAGRAATVTQTGFMIIYEDRHSLLSVR
jgi:hypothetical protein